MTIRNNNGMIKSALELAKQRVQKDYNSLQISGRALTKEEIKRSEALSNCLKYIEEALTVIDGK